MSIAYYDRHAASFFKDTAAADMSELYRPFLEHLPAGGAILDAGCGSGRDSLAFRRLGYHVEAFDGSVEIVRLAREYTGLPVAHLTFQDVAWDHHFDGIWACASLLHVSLSALPDVLAQLRRAVRPGGVIFASFKYGEGEREVAGRTFTDMSEASATALFEGGHLKILNLWTTGDVRPGRSSENWLNILGMRPA